MKREKRDYTHIEPKPPIHKKISGTFLYYDKQNGNGRIYSKQICEEIIDQFNKKLSNGNCLGELGQPKQFEVSLSNVSHVIRELYLDEYDKSLKGTIETLNTPKGKVLSEIIDKKMLDGFSVASRGIGNVDISGNVLDYKLITFDIIPKEESSVKGPLTIDDL